ncbi:MAG: micrococcal nuclease [Solirubrobacteraceae bacterium]|jgi:micrococcal nuclease|nr:micrococcal nuclease [Solirubrobacteraceae bacterium]
MRRIAPFVLLLAALAAAVFAWLPADRPATAYGEARVVRVVDGDTIRVRLGGREERVRYIGIDTPESVKPGTPVQCYAKRAARANATMVAGRRVRLVGDAEARDRYGRLLAYVYRVPDGAFVNAALVRDGYARTMTIAPNVAHADQFATLARGARQAGRGLWGACRIG